MGGVLFFAAQRVRYSHFVWHLFVVLGITRQLPFTALQESFARFRFSMPKSQIEKETSIMEVSIKSIRQTLLRLTARLGGNSSTQKYAAGELPLRSELFRADQMEHHGKALAGSHKVSPAHARITGPTT